MTSDKIKKILTTAFGISGIILLDQAGRAVVNHLDNSIVMMLVYFISYVMIGLWLTFGMYLLTPLQQAKRSLT